jgi:hypothetical protein
MAAWRSLRQEGKVLARKSFAASTSFTSKNSFFQTPRRGKLAWHSTEHLFQNYHIALHCGRGAAPNLDIEANSIIHR